MRNGQNKRMRGRNRPKGQNPLSRVYESNGPDVKVRGTAHHVAEKYVTLARDAQSSGDYVAAEAYLQHAEHYFRIIAAAQEAQAAQRQAQLGGRPEDVRDDDDDDDDMSPLDDRFSMPARFEQPAFQPQQNAFPQYQPPSQPAPGSGPQPHQQSGQGQRHESSGQRHERGDRPPRGPRPPQMNAIVAPQPEAAAPQIPDVEQLPAFITGGAGLPVAPSAGEGEADRFPLRRRRRRPGPRVGEGGTEGGEAGDNSISAE